MRVMENHIEMEEMRSQLAALKQKIADQEIVNDKILRKAVAAKMTGIHRHRNRVLVIGVIALALNVPYMCFMEFSWYLSAYTVFMILFSMYMTYSYHEAVEKSNVYSGNLLEAVKELKELKRKYNQSYWYSIPMVLIYLAWFLHEISLKFDAEFMKYAIFGILAGGVIGAVWGVRMNMKLVKMCEEIIAEIEE